MKRLLYIIFILIITTNKLSALNGKGSDTSPYLIYNAYQLAEVSNYLGETYRYTYFKLMANIDLTDWIQETDPINGWSPIGVKAAPFEGRFDGNNKTISGLMINRQNASAYDCGLFGYVRNGIIKNCNIKYTESSSNSSVFGVIEYTEISGINVLGNLVQNSVSKGTPNPMGGIIGTMEFGCTINNCSFEGSITGNYNIGGIVGYSYYGGSICSINSCYSKCTLTNSGDNTGGIVGCCYYFPINISNCKYSGDINGANNTGGIVGSIMTGERPIYYGSTSNTTNTKNWSGYGTLVAGEKKHVKISNCTTSGNIKGSDNVGGVIGYDRAGCNYTYDRCEVCYNKKGKLGNYDEGVSLWRDKILINVGFNYTYNAYDIVELYINDIYDSYFVGNIQGRNNVGGIAGQKETGIISKCYSASKVSGKSNIGGIIGYLSYIFEDFMNRDFSLTSNVSLNTEIISTSSGVGRIYGKIAKDDYTNNFGKSGTNQRNRALSQCSISMAGQTVSTSDYYQNGENTGATALKNSGTYTGIGWDFSKTWTINNGNSYPYLQWEKKISKITFDKTSLTIIVGETATINATIAPSDIDNKKLEWSTSDQSIAIVDNGVVSAVSEGVATIKATATDGSGISASCKVTVIKSNYTLTYKVDGEVYKSQSVRYGTKITPEEEPVKEGHTFSGWSDIPETMPAHDVVITGSFAINNYTLTYKVDGNVYKSASIQFGAKITPEEAPTKEGHTFSGWSNIPATMPAHDVVITGNFAINNYTLTYKVDGNVYKSASVQFGAKITPEEAPTKEGHTFSGWSNIPATMPAHDVVINGTFTVNSYKLVYIIDDVIYKSRTILFGGQITPEAAPSKEGYTFSGWSEIPMTMPAHDVEVTGSFSANEYKLIYKIDGIVYKTYSIACGTNIVPESAPIMEGYTFSGWNNIPETMPAHDVEVTGSFTINTYNVELSVGEGGTAIVSDKNPEFGSSIVLSINTDVGYELAIVLVNDIDVTSSVKNGSYTIINIVSDIKISVVFSAIVGMETIASDFEHNPIIDLYGRHVQNTSNEKIYIQNNKKFIMK